jgi:hypothetical protein
MDDSAQLTCLDSPDTRAKVASYVKQILQEERQPSPRELVAELDRAIGIVARWDLVSVLSSLLDEKDLTRACRAYLVSLLEGEDLAALKPSQLSN